MNINSSNERKINLSIIKFYEIIHKINSKLKPFEIDEYLQEFIMTFF